MFLMKINESVSYIKIYDVHENLHADLSWGPVELTIDK